ncbi:hypothetical protein ACJMK2_034151 [Sinanodonta woodiana]|uniref:Annexin n=1 Tax=Sinanodonta woodiana TaxID=1069815 RepID=A0ABD3WS36_SINWO
MSFYPSNYPSSYGGGYPNSGPPFPPMGGFQHGSYGSAYNVNAYSYQTGSAPPPENFYNGGFGGGGGGFGPGQSMVPGFTCPAVQNMSNQYNYSGAPMPLQMPQSYGYQMANENAMVMAQMMQMQMYKSLGVDMEKKLVIEQKKKQKKKKPVVRKEEDEEEEEPEEEEEEEAVPRISEDTKKRVRDAFLAEVMRRNAVSGTFEITFGTVVPYKKYLEDDPTVKYNKEKEGIDLAGNDWDPEADCQMLRNSIKGLGTDEDTITYIVSTRNNAQRQELKKMYKTMFGRDLIEEIKHDTSFNYKATLVGLFVPPAEYDAWHIKEAIYGLGTDEQALIEILMTRTNQQVRELVQAYKDVASPSRKVKDTFIEKDIEGDTSGDFKRLLISACQGNRREVSREQVEQAVEEIMTPEGQGTGLFQVNENKLVDEAGAKRDAEKLKKAGVDRWGTDEETFQRIFAVKDYYQLRCIWNHYVKLTQCDILNDIDEETSGNFKKGLCAVVNTIRNRPKYFAERLVKTMKGLGTDDKALIRIIITRAEIDMVQIKKEFLQLTNKTLWKWLQEDCSGSYKKLLQAIVKKD